MKTLKWLDKNFERVALMLLLAMISCLLMFQIIMRYCFSSALPWAEELARYAFVTSAYICIGYCIKEDLLFRIDALFTALPKKLQKALDILMWSVSLAFFLYCTKNSVTVTLLAQESKTVSPAMAMPTYWLFIVGTLGFVLADIRIAQRLVKVIASVKSTDTTTETTIVEEGAKSC